jgi:hypothetical protein
MANAISVAMAMPAISWRCFASIDIAVEAVDWGIMQMTSSSGFSLSAKMLPLKLI